MKIASYIVLLLIIPVLAACSSASPQPTPTAVDIGAMQTAAVNTVVANITQTAAALPTQTPEPTSTPAPSPTPGETPTAAVTATQSQCDNSAFVSDASVKDGTQMTAGQSFIKTWKFKNTGTCTWTTGYQIIFSHSSDGGKMGGLSTSIGTEVQPGAEAEISVTLIAPSKPGTYSGYWRLANNNGFPFGAVVSVVIVVP